MIQQVKRNAMILQDMSHRGQDSTLTWKQVLPDFMLLLFSDQCIIKYWFLHAIEGNEW